MKVWPGQPYPLGATWDGQGVNFALFSENATGVELCLFDDPQASQASQRISLIEQTDYVWHGYVPNLKPGQLYGYRVSGPFAPEEGQRFNPAKLLLDPYAKAVSGEIQWSEAMFSYPVNSAAPERDQQLNEQDNAGNMPKSVV